MAPSAEWQHGDFADLLALAPGRAPDSFVNRRYQPNPGGALYGGMLLCQALSAAQRTIEDKTGEGKSVHAMQAQFLRSGSTELPVQYDVARLRDGRRFSTRQVSATQHGRGIMQAQISFAAERAGPAWPPPPPPAPPPEALAAASALQGRYEPRLTRLGRLRLATFPAIEARFADPPTALLSGQDGPADLMWVRLPGAAGLDAAGHAAAIAYLSDWWLVSTFRPRLGDDPALERLRVTSLNHSLWLHMPARADGWMLYAMEALWTGGGRTLCQGRLFDRAGGLLATVSQEAMLAEAETVAG